MFTKNGENLFWYMLPYVKKYADFDGTVNFAWNLLKQLIFEDVNFDMF